MVLRDFEKPWRCLLFNASAAEIASEISGALSHRWTGLSRDTPDFIAGQRPLPGCVYHSSLPVRELKLTFRRNFRWWGGWGIRLAFK